MRIPIMLIFAAMLVTPSVVRAAHRIPSVEGVTLGMTSQDVLKRLRERRIQATVIARPCLSEYLSAHRKAVPIEDRSGHCIEHIAAQHAGGDLFIFFAEDVPRRPGVSTVMTLALNYPKDPKWLADIVHDVGPPSLTDGKRPWTVALWCFDFTCTNMERTVGDYKSQPTLLVNRQSGFTLNDAGAINDREQTIRRELHAHGITLER